MRSPQSSMPATPGPVRQGVILAAGRGSRLQPLSQLTPKPLAPICNKPIMQYQMEAMRNAGITDIAVVINTSGSNGHSIKKYFGSGTQFGLALTYIEDPHPAGIASSFALTESWVRGPVAVFLGDIFVAIDDFTPALQYMDCAAAGCIVVRHDTVEAVRRNFSVELAPDGRVHRVVEKPANPNTGLKGVGVYVFDQTIFEAIHRTPASALRNEVEITDAVQNLIDMGRPVWPSDVVKWDVNITYPEDLLRCNLRVLQDMELEYLIGEGTKLSSEAQFIRSVVGHDAVVESPAIFTECIILPGVDVGVPHGAQHRRIFAEGLVWSSNEAHR